MKNLTSIFLIGLISLLFAVTLFGELNDDLFYRLEDLTFSEYEGYDVVKLKGCDFSLDIT